MKNSTFKLATLVSAALLSACGGGGGGDGATTTPTPTPSVSVGTLATSVPTPTYAAGSVEKAIFDKLNEVRLSGGFGMLAQDTVLDKAALNHAAYLEINYFTKVNGVYPNGSTINDVDPATGQLNAHSEKAAWTGFTGILSDDRAKAAGKAFADVGEVISFSQAASQCVPILLNTVFHRSGLLKTAPQSVGIGYLSNTTPEFIGSDVGSACVINSAYQTANTVATNWIGLYPLDKQTSVPVTMTGEAPDPAPEILTKGSPVSLYTDSKLASVTTFTLTASGSSTPVPVKLITSSSFPTHLTTNEAHILPTQALAKGTVYNVSFRGLLSNNKAVARDWSFTTGQ